MTENTPLWEILVPRCANSGLEYEVGYHRQWDDRVREIARGVTILHTAKGQWRDPSDGAIFVEEMIPVRVYCTEPQIDEIMELTLKHYDQRAVMAYLVSERVKILYGEN
ncbi:MAG: DUF3574 domain-containing protein [Nanoarchaeota archaeon]|nr:DUF3574 domain-containing protein [Nanoarchaeota archaeon]